MFLRLRQIALVARDLNSVTDDLRAVLGLEICYRDPGVEVFGLHNALLPVGNQFIEVVSPIREGTAGGRYLERRHGDGGYMVITHCDDHAQRKQHIEKLGVRKVLESDSKTYNIMQLHPRDTGGSFLEIDFQAGGEDPNGPWEPAGKNWQAAVRTDVVRAITTAEIQSPDHQSLAERWSEILQLPIQPDGAGRPSLKVSNASIRFVPDRDGRGEGLGGIDLEVADRNRLLANAEKRGKKLSDGALMLGGMRIGVA